MSILLLNIGDWATGFYDRYKPILDRVFGDLAAFLPKLFGALFLLIIGWILGRTIARLIKRLLERIGADKLADRINEIDLFARSPVKLKPSLLFSKFFYYLIFFIFFMAATDALGVTAVSDMIRSIFDYLPRVISALFMFVIGILLADLLKKAVLTACTSLNIPAAGLIANFVFYFIFINVAMLTLSQAGIETGFFQDNISIILAGVVGAFALGYGYASRPLVANLLSSYYNRNKVKVGDVIGIDDVKGQIVEMDNSTMTIASEGKRTVIPLGRLSTDKFEIYN
jgi:hypothetical protein